MDGLQASLASSYERHPQFRFEQPPLHLDAERLAAFEAPYESVRSRQGPPGAAELRAARDRCRQALADVFAQLLGQAADAHEAAFLQELGAECQRLAGEELDEFGKRPRARPTAVPAGGAQDDASRLRRDRFFFGRLPAAATREILDAAATELVILRGNAQRGQVTREDLSRNSGPTTRTIKRILNREFRRRGVLDAVSTYAGRRMSVTGLALELSVPQARWWASAFAELPRAPKTLYAHMDEGIAFPKSIVYLSDVDEATGQTSCYPRAYEALGLGPLQEIVGRVIANVGNRSPLREYYGKQYHQSMSSERFRRHFMRLPPSIRFNSHFGWDVLPESELEAALTRREQFMTGPAGTFIVFDGARLLHRGGMVQERERIALQVIFSDATIGRELLGKVRKALA